MIGIGSALIVLQVARDAAGVGQVVISVDVTLSALQRDVRTGQRKAGLAVIEGRVCPRRGGVAALTGLRHAGLHVIGVGCSLVVLEVARDARRDSQVEVSIEVTLGAWRCDVHAGQREAGLAVIEGRIGP